MAANFTCKAVDSAWRAADRRRLLQGIFFATGLAAALVTDGCVGRLRAQPSCAGRGRPGAAAGATAAVAGVCAAAPVRDLSPAAASALRQAVGTRAVFIDVRSWGEAERGVAAGVDFVVPLRRPGLAGAIAAAEEPDFVDHVDAAVRLAGGDRDTPVLLICRSGGRSSAAARRLAQAGYTQVVSVIGGMEGKPDAFDDDEQGWSAAGLPVERRADPQRLLRWKAPQD
jgi:rhodanese-related sulfurtransferase